MVRASGLVVAALHFIGVSASHRSGRTSPRLPQTWSLGPDLDDFDFMANFFFVIWMWKITLRERRESKNIAAV